MIKKISLLILLTALSVQSADKKCNLSPETLEILNELEKSGNDWSTFNSEKEVEGVPEDSPFLDGLLEPEALTYLPTIAEVFTFFKENPLGQKCLNSSEMLQKIHNLIKENGASWLEENYPNYANDYIDQSYNCRFIDRN